jgi:hypothetical protein
VEERLTEQSNLGQPDHQKASQEFWELPLMNTLITLDDPNKPVTMHYNIGNACALVYG